ncbi:MAG: transglycosylase SLT domain-containing protein [Thermodesulfobacteriota bacterium]
MEKIPERFFLCFILICAGLFTFTGGAYAHENAPEELAQKVPAPVIGPAYAEGAFTNSALSCAYDGAAYLEPIGEGYAGLCLYKETTENALNGEEGPAEINPLPDVPIVVNNKVESFIKYFQTSARGYFVKWLKRTGGYDNLIKKILREKGMPEELFYVALIESGLNPRARSRRNAVGMWQFVKPTAVRYGLRVDWWIDERMDPEKSTVAAAKFLKRLYGRFDSWYLAVAGYNAGPGRVSRAVKRHKTNDYWKLTKYRRPLNRETRQYVGKYLAAMLIAKDPEKYGFENIDYAQDVEYEKVGIPHATDIKVIAKAAGITVKEFKHLNPELIRWFTPPDYSDYEVKLPPEAVDRFNENFKRIPKHERLKFYKHRVKRGDTLWAIARRYRTRIKPILYLNGLKNARFIRAGRLIVIPVRAGNTKAKKL